MEIASRPQGRENTSPINSPHSNGSSSSNTNGNGVHIQSPPLPANTAVYRSEPNPSCPTTFVQADTATFKHVVQMLTGSSETGKQASKPPVSSDSAVSSKGHIPPIKTGQKRQGFKLYERRNNLKNGFMISPLVPGSAMDSTFLGKKSEIFSPCVLDFPSLVLSPVTPLIIEDPFDKSSPSVGSSPEEEKAIAEKKFYLHPSPRTTPGGCDPKLLPLFPVTSPRITESSSS